MQTVRSKDGTKIAYKRQGQGPALILVDGAMCYSSSGPMGPLAARLEDRFTIYTYDRRGRGKSGDAPSYAVDREIEDLDALIGLAGGAAFVYGISSGAVLVLRAAAVPGSKLIKLALYEPPFVPGSDIQNDSGVYTRQLNDLLSKGSRGDAVALFMKKVSVQETNITAMRQAPMWAGMEALAPTLAYDDAVMGDGSLPVDIAQRVSVPALILDGGESPAFMRTAAAQLSKAMPRAEYRTMAGQTHDVQPEALAPLLVEYFRL